MGVATQTATSITAIVQLQKGDCHVTLTGYTTSALSTIHEGSAIEVAGTCFHWATAETPGGWVDCTTAATVYLHCVPSGTAGSQVLTSGWLDDAPVWHDVNQGWYASAASSTRVIASAYKTSNTSQNDKRILSDKIVDEGRTNVLVANGGVVAGAGNATLLKKVVNIGDWNMDATATLSVAHGVTATKIRSVQVLIRNDGDEFIEPLNSAETATHTDNQGGFTIGVPASSDNTVVTMWRKTGGRFDNTDYNATSYNRGWIVIEYIP